MLSFDELRADVESGAIDTVVVAFTDMQGRLMGKRLHGEFFVEEIDAGHAGRGLQLPARARDGDGPGARLRDRELGAGLRRLRRCSPTWRRCGGSRGSRRPRSCSATSAGTTARRWRPRRARCCARRSSGRRRSASRRCSAPSSSSILLKETYEEAHAQHYRDLTPSVPYILDYHILATTYDEPFIRQIRNGMQGAGIKVETSKGEAWPGQHEINFRYADALTMADNHVDLQERRQGDRAPERLLDHVHGEARPHLDRQLVPHPLVALARRARAPSRARRRCSSSGSRARSRACKELAIFLAPTINSYKRYAAGSWAPTTLAWGHDNRTCGFRIVGHGPALRVETRIPGADVNPYLAFAALIAAGLDGIEHGLELPPALEGNAYESDADRFPHSLREAIAALEDGHDGARRASATRSSTTTSTTRAPSRSSSTGSSPATSASGSSSAAEAHPRSARPSSGSRRTPSRACAGAPGTCRRRCPARTTCGRSRRPAGGRCSCRRARTGSRRRSTCSTGSSSPAARTSTRREYGAGAAPRDDGHAPGARPGRAGAPARPRSSATCRCSRSAAARRC